jgi:hypothetical protein
MDGGCITRMYNNNDDIKPSVREIIRIQILIRYEVKHESLEDDKSNQLK